MDRISLIYKVLSGEASGEEKRELKEWIARSEANREEFDDIKLLWESSSTPADTDQEDDDGFEGIRKRMQQHLQRSRRMRYAISTGILAVVAVILLVHLKQTWLRSSDSMQFNSASIRDVIQVLQETYDIKIEVSQSGLLDCKFSATFYNINEKDAALRSIEHSLNVQFVADAKNRYHLVGNGCLSF